MPIPSCCTTCIAPAAFVRGPAAGVTVATKVATGLGRHRPWVGVIKGPQNPRARGRNKSDRAAPPTWIALPIEEATNLAYASQDAGAKMHACGHDGHTAMLPRPPPAIWRRPGNFAGDAVVIFQPAEEGGAGARPP